MFTFKSRQDNLIPDQSGYEQPLRIPAQPTVLQKTFLAPPWKKFKPNRSFFIDATINLFGFIPLGIVLIGLLKSIKRWPVKLTAPAIVAFCFLVSLGVEIIQAWMPTRSSSLLDLLLNTLGAWIGIWLYEKVGRIGRVN